MCDDCKARAAHALSVMFGAVKDNELIADMNTVLDVLLPGMGSEPVEPNLAKLTRGFMDMGGERVGNIARACGYMAAVLDEINAEAITAVYRMAKAGNTAAIAWMNTHGDKITVRDEESETPPANLPKEVVDLMERLASSGPGGMIVMSLGRPPEGAEPDFTRPMGAAKPHLH